MKKVKTSMNSILASFTTILSLIFLLNACSPKTEKNNTIDGNISGVVTGPTGPEAGVWVIAETFDLPTRFAKIVVSDDEGRYLIPELPSASYKVWVRGYGLDDSPKKDATPGTIVNLDAVVAPTEAAAAQYYPAGYWFSMLHIPSKDKFPGTGSSGNGIAEEIKVQADYLRRLKSGTCLACHQLGSKGTRELQASLGTFNNSIDAWERRLQAGQAGANMVSPAVQMGRDEFLKMFADWTDRIAQGELPKQVPPRPQGVERNVVISQWDWADQKVYLHDLVSTDRRNPTVNANGSLYGALELSGDYLPVLDPIKNSTSQIPLTVRDPNTPVVSGDVAMSSPYWGDTAIWNSKTNVHNPMIDSEGRVWITAAVRGRDNPDFCKEGSDHPSAKNFPLDRSYRQLGFYDPKSGKYTAKFLNFN